MIGHDKWIILLIKKFLLNWIVLFVILFSERTREGINGFIYIIVVIELEITIMTNINIIIPLVIVIDVMVFSLGINPSRGGIPIREKIEIIIPNE